MLRRSMTRLRLLAPVFLISCTIACGGARSASKATGNTPTAPVAVEPVQSQPPPEDPVVTLIAQSDEHFKAGQRELELGHVEGARLEFDKAVNVLLESPWGGRT